MNFLEDWYKKGKNRWKILARFLVSFQESFVFLERVQFHEGCRSFVAEARRFPSLDRWIFRVYVRRIGL